MTIRIDTDLLIIGDGQTIEKAAVIVDGDKITFAGAQADAPEADKTLHSPVVMPGMVECHGHFTGIRSASVVESLFTKPEIGVLRSIRDTRAILRAGFTTVREVGGYGIILKQAIDEGLILGPRIYAAGRILSTTGGHGDVHDIPLDVVEMLDQGLGILCDGVDECYKAVRTNLREGAEVIKFCASGGVMSKIDHPLHQQFSLEEQRAIVEEAKRSEVAIAAHCHGAAGIEAAVEAGVTSIEHGTFLTEELADKMIEKGTILVPTRYVLEKLGANTKALGVPKYAVKKFEMTRDAHSVALKLAIKKGIKIAVGTDVFVSGPNPVFQHGENAMELEFLVDHGMSPMDAIVAATKNGIETLGPRAPKAGEIKEGYDADILLLERNPLEDIKILQNLNNIQVMKAGKLIPF